MGGLLLAQIFVLRRRIFIAEDRKASRLIAIGRQLDILRRTSDIAHAVHAVF
jgi:hypothetical protein